MPDWMPSYDVYLAPGEYSLGQNAKRIKTILGSCIAVTLWHPETQTGGMGHFMLPSRGEKRPGTPGSLDGKYADELLEVFLSFIRTQGTDPHEYEIKLFGGGNMFPELSNATDSTNVSMKNIQAIRQLVKAHGLQVKSQHLGGNGYRNILFDMRDGYVYMSFMSSGRQVQARQARYAD